ncbi:putative BTB/POZ domain-containing protein [Raphanus sativus]|uniref:BTB/POZ domain-containing protein At2g40450 n=1 Tax=Raphanus sativus TaxID=3726 RepID=A0A6J0MUM6_RAPSA|nr:putative BTB/POZ domain-containing protein At2g40450 [Raphanus sativus]KAJ4906707.1 putative BTB/POZ domain-containing protein [Raphanus sativus]
MATERNREIFLGGLKKLLKEKWQADVLLKAGNSAEGATISAHKLVLASRSVVLRKIMESDEFKASSKLETVTFSEMKYEELEAFVEFMYCSISPESLKKHVSSLYLAADKYEIPYLRDVCRSLFISSLNPANALNIIELAQRPFDKALNDVAFTTIKDNISTIASSAEFKLFVVNNPYLSVEIMKASLIHPHINNKCRYCGHVSEWKQLK